jgi:hypothetical protein
VSEPRPLVGMRVFDEAALQAAVSKALEAIPAGKSGAIVAHADLKGAQLSIMARTQDGHWTLLVRGYRPWNGPLETEAEAVIAW